MAGDLRNRLQHVLAFIQQKIQRTNMTATATPIVYYDVPVDGDIGGGHTVPVDGLVSVTGALEGGCGDPACEHCQGTHSYTRLFPRDEQGVVFGYVVEFGTREELEATPVAEIERIARSGLH